MTRCAVLGSPVAHSLSPVLHRAAYAELGLDWVYDAVETTEASLPGFLAGLDASWRGLSLTMPLKRTVVPLLDVVSDRAVLAGAANTVVLDAGRRAGDNTDIPGITAALAERGVHAGDLERVLVLGGGATAASAALACSDLGVRELVLGVRDPGRAADTLAAVARHPTPARVSLSTLTDLDASTDRSWDLLVSTVPASAQGPGLVGLVGRVPVVFEVLYEPWPTPLAAAAEESGRTLVGGLDLLVHQAVLQVELMTGRPGPLAAMRAAGEAALASRRSPELRP